MFCTDRQEKNGLKVKSGEEYFSFRQGTEKMYAGFYLTYTELQIKIQDFVLHTWWDYVRQSERKT